MDKHRIKTALRISLEELRLWLQNSRCILLAVMLVFVHMLVITPLSECAADMEQPVSILEAFIALANSGSILLVIPLLYLVLIADYPQVSGNFLFCQIRCDRLSWIMGQMLFAAWSAIFTTLFLFVSSCVMMLLSQKGTWQIQFSDAVTHYTSVFPDRRGAYICSLLPENLYQQMPLAVSLVHSLCLVCLHFFITALLILLLFLIQKKYAGILISGTLLMAGTLGAQVRDSWMWLFPLAHTIPWLHYEKYIRQMVFPMTASYAILCGYSVLIILLCLLAAKKYQPGIVSIHD